jgi:leucyl aminopeptidase (aminopeptidase T)
LTSDAWQRAAEHFRQSLPEGVTEWIVLAESGAHANVIAALKAQMTIAEVVTLGEDPPELLVAVAARYARQQHAGLLDFALANAEVRYDGRYLAGLRQFATWPAKRCRLCIDVWDLNFASLFAEPPGDVTRRCQAMAARLRGKDRLTYRAQAGKSQLDFACAASEWVVYSAAEDYDTTLPSGEVACLPQSVDGDAELDGWIVGTIPFGPKYGRIGNGDLGISFRHGEVVALHGGHHELRADLERILDRDPGLRSVGELGIGQSLAVRASQDLHQRGCLWHEKITGLHLGLGAELAQTSAIEDRRTGHHVDLVFAHGTLTAGPDDVLLDW